jgi:hypothetical protein
MVRRTLVALVAAVAVAAFAAGAGAIVSVVTASASSTPSGQRTFGRSVLEPVYNDENPGEIGYIKQPMNAPQPLPANEHAVSPFYLVVYPVTSTVATTTTFLCQHLPTDNCPTHGNGIAILASAREPSVYGVGGAGVAGHDHLMDFPGGSDFNIAWEPTVILFTAQGVADGAVNTHVLTDVQIDALLSSRDAIEVQLPTRTFICGSVPGTLYDMATPAS